MLACLVCYNISNCEICNIKLFYTVLCTKLIMLKIKCNIEKRSHYLNTLAQVLFQNQDVVKHGKKW